VRRERCSEHNSDDPDTPRAHAENLPATIGPRDPRLRAMQPVLAHVTADAPVVRRTAYVLHGILGTKSNWRGLARRFADALDGWGFVVVDLRKHGESQAFDPPHTLDAVVGDLVALSAQLGRPADAVIGHSFGAKCALAWTARGDGPSRGVILDTNPGARTDGRGSESTLEVLRVLAGMGQRFASREAFVNALTDAGIARDTALWLAMNLVADAGAWRFRLDLDAIDALLADYFAQDLWPALESPRPGIALDVVVGGRSEVLSREDRARLDSAALAHPAVRVTTLPDAGHWVHVDAPDEVTAVVLRALGG
jgi:esterase